VIGFIRSWGTTIGAVVVIVGALVSSMAFVGWPPYAEKAVVEDLAQQVADNTEAGFLRQLENALARGDQAQIRRICNVISKLYGYRAAGCP